MTFSSLIDKASKHPLWVFCILAPILLALVYRPGLGGPFVFDDLSNVILPPQLKLEHISLDSLNAAARARDGHSLNRPLAMITFGLNRYAGGLDPFWFKLTNLLIHLFCGIGLMWLSWKLLDQLSRAGLSRPLSGNEITFLSLSVSLAWLLHPINLTTVLYIVQRMTGLAALFMIWGLVLYVSGRVALIHGQKKGYLSVFIAYYLMTPLAIASKEIGVLLPAFIIALEFLIFRFACAADQRRKFIRLWFAAILLPVAIAGLIFLFKADHLLNLGSYQIREFSMPERLMTQARVLWFYLGLIASPDLRILGLFHDDFSLSYSLLNPISTLPAVLGIAALPILAIALRKRATVASLGIVWFLLGHVVESSIIPLELIHEHRNYLPSWGPLFAAFYYISYPAPKWFDRQKLQYALLVLIVTLFGSITYARSHYWQSDLALYQTSVQHHPKSARSHTQYGFALRMAKAYKEADHHFAIAALLNKKDPSYIVRLMHNRLSIDNKIDHKLLHELERRYAEYPAYYLMLWYLEPLIADTLDMKTENDRLFQVYFSTIQRKDLYIDAHDLASANRFLGDISRKRKQYSSAIHFYKAAQGLAARIDDGLELMELYLLLKDSRSAGLIFSDFSQRNHKLSAIQEKRLALIAHALGS